MSHSKKVENSLPWFMRKGVKRMSDAKRRQKLLYPNGAFGSPIPRGSD